MSSELEQLKSELAREKQQTNHYKRLYEEEKAENHHLHDVLNDLRKKCEKWYNSTEMEEEMLVNKVNNSRSSCV